VKRQLPSTLDAPRVAPLDDAAGGYLFPGRGYP
jgi:hypothetical protein